VGLYAENPHAPTGLPVLMARTAHGVRKNKEGERDAE